MSKPNVKSKRNIRWWLSSMIILGVIIWWLSGYAGQAKGGQPYWNSYRSSYYGQGYYYQYYPYGGYGRYDYRVPPYWNTRPPIYHHYHCRPY